MAAKILVVLVLGTYCMESWAASWFCPAKACASNQTEVERWDCWGKHLFRPRNSRGRYVQHPCAGLGWGNSMSSLIIAAELASVLNARLVFEQEIDHLWELPREYNLPRAYPREHWSYEKNAREEESLKNGSREQRPRNRS